MITRQEILRGLGYSQEHGLSIFFFDIGCQDANILYSIDIHQEIWRVTKSPRTICAGSSVCTRIGLNWGKENITRE